MIKRFFISLVFASLTVVFIAQYLESSAMALLDAYHATELDVVYYLYAGIKFASAHYQLAESKSFIEMAGFGISFVVCLGLLSLKKKSPDNGGFNRNIFRR